MNSAKGRTSHALKLCFTQLETINLKRAVMTIDDHDEANKMISLNTLPCTPSLMQ